jgi:hypothetical protein
VISIGGKIQIKHGGTFLAWKLIRCHDTQFAAIFICENICVLVLVYKNAHSME